MSMVAKLSEDEILARTPMSRERIEEGRLAGIVKQLSPDTAEVLEYPIYSDEFLANPEPWDDWKHLLVCRAVETQPDGKSLFHEIAEIYLAFNYADDMKHLVYFEPATSPEASPQKLRNDIQSYYERARRKLAQSDKSS